MNLQIVYVRQCQDRKTWYLDLSGVSVSNRLHFNTGHIGNRRHMLAVAHAFCVRQRSNLLLVNFEGDCIEAYEYRPTQELASAADSVDPSAWKALARKKEQPCGYFPLPAEARQFRM